ncbi:TetR/AcrR family transcriptional regulator [Sandaracinobacteroides hominis]|uniref:TetR/AcrR family transcriptional regulator n=1 Tax=Sandaracinobacteroides hominis TaxID=2780086 RepID=UPI0018F4C120|nr:TetR/AcrR family transcriptional regulator [Sandaracinobacteroides hominis]
MATQVSASGNSASGSLRERRLTRRGADTRERILEATVTCIVRRGFAAMTVENVMAESGISRGSVLHQFPNRIALAEATFRRTLETVIRDGRRLALAIDDPFERLAGYSQIVWDSHSTPDGLALSEILQAARWDRELAAAIEPVTRLAEQEVAVELTELAVRAGISEPEAMIARGWLLVASARGLILEGGLHADRPVILAAVAEMQRSHRRFCERMRRI